MKKSILYMAGLVMLLTAFASCEKWIDPDLNVDPDRPQDVTLNLILPSIQAQMGYDIGGNEAVRTSGIWMQHFDGIARQSKEQANYGFSNADPNNFWNSMYASTMMDIYTIIQKGKDQNSPHWTAVGKIQMALNLGVLTDLFGSVPYTEAFLGNENLQPAFNTQQEIYTAIQTLLDEAIVEIDQENVIALGGDMIYGGDPTLWKKAAYALKARYLIHTVNVNTAAKSQALGLIANAFTSNDEDMQLQWGPGENSEASPLFQFMSQRGDIRMCATLVDFLASTNDPRLPAYASVNEAGEYLGAEPGLGTDADDLSWPAGIYFEPDGITTFMSFVELKFIEAEAALGTDNDRAVQAYKDAVQASLEKHGVFDQAWFDANIGVETAGTLTLAKVMQQKWVALYGQMEPYNDWRRSNNEIGLQLAGEASLSQIPYRWAYPVEEQGYNENCPQGRDLTTSMWWMGSADPGPNN